MCTHTYLCKVKHNTCYTKYKHIVCNFQIEAILNFFLELWGGNLKQFFDSYFTVEKKAPLAHWTELDAFPTFKLNKL